VDESLFTVSHLEKESRCVVMPNYAAQKQANRKPVKINASNVSLTAMVRADGHFEQCYYKVQSKNKAKWVEIPDDIPSHHLRNNPDEAIKADTSVWFNGEESLEFLKAFAKRFRSHNPNDTRYSVVLIDNCSAHNEVIQHFHSNIMEERVVIVPLPPNTTHFLQPLDGKPFAIAKQKWRSELKKADGVWQNNCHKAKSSIATVMGVMKESMTKQAILSGFGDRGIMPFCPDKIRARRPIADIVTQHAQQLASSATLSGETSTSTSRNATMYNLTGQGFVSSDVINTLSAKQTKEDTLKDQIAKLKDTNARQKAQLTALKREKNRLNSIIKANKKKAAKAAKIRIVLPEKKVILCAFPGCKKGFKTNGQ